MLRRSLLNNQAQGGGISPSTAEACDVVFANKTTEQLIIVRDQEDWPSKDEWEPIGVVVIPGEHNVYNNGSCGVMSIVAMNCNTPTIGGDNQDMHWGDIVDITTLFNYNKVVITSNKSSNTSSRLSSGKYANLPIQRQIGGIPERNHSQYAPSPYAGTDYKSGERNDSYSTTKHDSALNKNVLADFDGRGNTSKIITQRGVKDYSSWKPIWYKEIDYPPASCCNMFKTTGTRQGNWYLPAMGELGYIAPKICDINNTIEKLNSEYGIGIILDLYGNTVYDFGLWSSSECDSNDAYTLCYNMVTPNNKDLYNLLGDAQVRAFLQL